MTDQEEEEEPDVNTAYERVGDYAIVGKLGKGSYGTVYEGIGLNTDKRVAIKRLFGRIWSETTLKRYLREIEIMKSLKHKNLANAITTIYDERKSNPVYIVMELFPADLRKLIHSSEWLEPIQVKKIMYEAMVGLNYIHSAGIVHRDIKPANILVNEKCEVKICDFNLARSTHGLTSDSFDFDKIYRKEFSSSLPSTLSADSEPEDETIPDELDDSAEEHKIVSLPGRFDVGIGKTHARMALTSQSSDTLRKSLATPTPPKKPHREGSVSDLGMRKIVRRDDKPKDLDLRRKALMNNTQSKISKRELTTHVTTRWYRAPEVVLMDRVYSSAVDIWSMGCVLGELLQTVKGCVAAVADRRPMFPGTSCYPLSPGKRHCSGDGDQLDKILSVTGTPSEEDVAFLTEYGAKQYIKQMKKYAKADFAKLFPVADPLAIDLLGKMLTFNPYLRITAKEALEHPYFREVRCPAKEVEAQQIVLKAEHAADRRAALISLCK